MTARPRPSPPSRPSLRVALALAAGGALCACTAPPLPDPPRTHPASPQAEESPDTRGAQPLATPPPDAGAER